MPRRKLNFVRGVYYHIYNRGANKATIFCSDENYRYFLRLMKRDQHALQVTFVAYCLMPNHYHWLVRQDGDTAAGLLPQRVCKAYSNAFNNSYKRAGALFEGSYKALVVDDDEYLHQVCRYIHANPVRHGFAPDPAVWPYSNYLEWIGERCGTLVDRQLVQEHFPAPDAYRAYVTSYTRNEVILPAQLQQSLQSLEAE
jgi:REP element-mobilizing transposase RayT